MTNGARRGNTGGDRFEQFMEAWLVRQEQYLDELMAADQRRQESPDHELKELINRVLAHYQEYYEEKSRVAHRNIFLVFSPTWFTPFERAFLWIAGFKPSLAFRVVHDSVDDLSDDQRRRLGRLKEETRVEEKMLNDELARIQESVAAPPLLRLMRRRGRTADGEEVEAAEENMRAALESVVASADLLRTRTVVKVAEILSPAQNVRFLTAGTQLQKKIRSWGLQIEASRPQTRR